MISIIYENNSNKIKQYHEYPGRAMGFRMLEPEFSVWHVPKELSNKVYKWHDTVIIVNGVPVGTELGYKRKERVKGIAVQTGGLWGLPIKEPYLNQNTVLMARFKGLGDVLMSWFAVEEYRRQYPEQHITYLTSPQSAALFCGQDIVDKVFYTKFEHPATPGIPRLPINTKSYSYVFNTINQVDFGEVAYIKARADNFADLLGVNIKAEYNESIGKWIPEIPIRQLQVNPEEVSKARELVKWSMNDRIAVLQLNSNGQPRQWFYWNALAKKLKDYKVVYLSTDPAHVDMKTPKNVINLACKTNIREYIAILAIAHILVCVDTSALHIGARLDNLKVIPLFGSTGPLAHSKYYQNVYPIQGQAICSPCWDWQLDCCDNQKDRLTCMKRITADMVWNKIKAME